ncbi:winged helix-turn-helix transcriptional regulator [Geobacter sp. AOG2]|uniref:winged helix-turn-helix transcriptional regulator n=1 Tax=Geobacter sp. AOG2 TaxID=1566347 RepID=UPI001CC79F16|nr:winged helix-turn-helix transcriptional regulator [Geobacter sp. AOG2]GFE59807.1 endonuclease III [Geobacter sp. AOG2]
MTLNPEHLTSHYHETGTLAPATVKAFRKLILAHHRTNPRPMPWRETRDPYRILVSEIMLQQTQVERVKAKYAEFLASFPTLADLAAAPLPSVLQVWQGLGYNRRALALKRCAEEIVDHFAGRFPTAIEELEALPGIGPYTARAVATFAFGAAEPFIETNIRTVFIHFFFHNRDQVGDREIMPLVAATLDRADPRTWYYGLMDYGVLLKQNHPNPGRRSAHHTRQSKFEGSNRQLRSRMLREVMEQPGITAGKLAELLGAEPEAVKRNLEAMEREGFLYKQGKGMGIKG